VTDDLSDRPQQFKTREAELHAEWEQRRGELQDWEFPATTDNRDLRDPSTVGETLLRMKRSGRHEDEVAESLFETLRLRDEIDTLESYADIVQPR
jgi:hypothetical protein